MSDFEELIEMDFLSDDYKKALAEKYGATGDNSDTRIKRATEMLVEEGVHLIGWQKEVFDIFVMHCGRAGGKTYLIEILKKLDDECFFDVIKYEKMGL